MANGPGFLVVGGGLAGGKAVETLRDEGYDGQVVIVAAEPERPYERPPLSKAFLVGDADRDSVHVHPEGWYAEHDVDLRTGSAVAAVDRAAHTATLDDGTVLAYEKLLLATGSIPRRLTAPGGDLEGVLTLRTLRDSEVLRDALSSGGRVVVVGGGWIGLETASAARRYGGDVTLVEPQPTPLFGVVGQRMGEMFASLHRDHGVRLLLGTGVAEVRGAGGRANAVVTDGGEVLPADVVVVGVGITPDVRLAEQAGLDVDNGVLVDERLRTSDPDVFAAGDVANAFHPFLGRRVRVEHWANALNGGPHAARSMLGSMAPYDRIPYFYSDQYDLGLEYSGLASPADDQLVVRGDEAARELIAFWVREGRVVAGMNVNVWDATDAIQRLVRSRSVVDLAQLADPAVPLDDLAGPAV